MYTVILPLISKNRIGYSLQRSVWSQQDDEETALLCHYSGDTQGHQHIQQWSYHLPLPVGKTNNIVPPLCWLKKTKKWRRRRRTGDIVFTLYLGRHYRDFPSIYSSIYVVPIEVTLFLSKHYRNSPYPHTYTHFDS